MEIKDIHSKLISAVAMSPSEISYSAVRFIKHEQPAAWHDKKQERCRKLKCEVVELLNTDTFDDKQSVSYVPQYAGP